MISIASSDGRVFFDPVETPVGTLWVEVSEQTENLDTNEDDKTQCGSDSQTHEVLGDMDVNDLIQDYTVDARVDDGVDPEAPWILRCDPWRKAIADKQADMKPDDKPNMKPDNEPKAEPADKPSPRPTAAKSKPRSIPRPLASSSSIPRPLASSSSFTRHCSTCTCSKPSTEQPPMFVTEQH